MSNPTRKTRKRACDSCHQRKIHCDTAPSQCNFCKHQGLVCSYDRPSRRRQGTNRNISRAKEADGRTTYGSPADLPMVQVEPLFRAGLGSFHFAGFHLGALNSFNGIPFFSDAGEKWIQKRAGTGSSFRALCETSPPWQVPKERQPSVGATVGNCSLPERSAVEAYFSVYCRSALTLVFPIIDASSFQNTIDRAYSSPQDCQSLDSVSARACVFSFTSVLVLMEGKLEPYPGIDHHHCASQAQHSVPHLLSEVNCELLQICASQCMYNIFSGNIEAAASYHATACRLVQMFGAHLEPAIGNAIPGMEKTWSMKRHLRRLFWLCYMYDKDIASRTGHPPVIDDDHCDLTLPLGYKLIDDFDTFKDSDDLFPGDVRLSIIKSKTIKLLYSVRAFYKLDAELFKDIRELDDELERWRMSIEEDYRPNLTSSYRLHIDPTVSRPKKVHIIVIHLEYYSILAMIHNASGRCRAWTHFEKDDNMVGISSSRDLALQASRLIIMNLCAVNDVLNWGDFWIFVFYPISASLTIFCNILLDPLNSNAREDMTLLGLVPELVKSMRARQLTIGDMFRLEPVDEFVKELRRLAEHAILKSIRQYG